MPKKESPEDKARRVYADLELAFSGMKTILGPQPMGALGELLAPVAILQQFGTSPKISKQIDIVEATAIINRDLPGIVTEERGRTRSVSTFSRSVCSTSSEESRKRKKNSPSTDGNSIRKKIS